MRKTKFNYDAEVFHTKSSGDFKILERKDNGKYIIQFIKTGTIMEVYQSAIRNGSIKDKFHPSVCGVGYIGDFEGYTHSKENIILYSTWKHMIQRCYNQNNKDYHLYGGAGVTVDVRWYNFSNFFEDAKLLPGYENKIKYPDIYCLDKDYLQMNIPNEQRIYSKNTCIWISTYDNITLKGRENSTSKYYGVTSRHEEYHAAYYSNIEIGIFTSAIAAANAYNYYYQNHVLNTPFHDLNIINNVPYMNPIEFIKYNKNPKEMCKIIK